MMIVGAWKGSIALVLLFSCLLFITTFLLFITTLFSMVWSCMFLPVSVKIIDFHDDPYCFPIYIRLLAFSIFGFKI